MTELTSMDIYWLLKLDALHKTVTALGLIGLLVSAGILAFCLAHKADNRTLKVRHWFWFIVPFCFSILLLVGKMIPTTKQMCIIKGVPWLMQSKAAEEVAEDVKEIYKDGLGVLKDKLKEQKEKDKDAL